METTERKHVITFDQIKLDAMRYFGFSLKEAEEMTMREYSYLAEAYRFKRRDAERDLYLAAYLSREVNATEKRGKKTYYVYESFDDFYKTREPKKVESNLRYLMVKANSL